MFNERQVHMALEDFIKDVRKITGDKNAKIGSIHNCRKGEGKKCNIGVLQSDNGTEYKIQELKQLLEREGIIWEPCLPHKPQHNGCAERLNLEIETKSSIILERAKMPTSFWVFALEYRIYIHNWMPNSTIGYKTSNEMLTGRSPKLANIRQLGCAAIYADENKNQKFATSGKLRFLIACSSQRYKVLDAESLTPVKTKDVDFIESLVYGDFSQNKDRNKHTMDKLEIDDPYKCICPKIRESRTPMNKSI